MSKSQLLIGVLVLACSGVHPSSAEIYVVNAYDLNLEVSPVAAINVINLGAEIVGITDVSARVVGIGGGGTFDCIEPIPDGWYDLDVKFAFGNGWFGFSTTNQVPFDVVADHLASDPDPWSVCEGTPQCLIAVTSYAQGTQYSDCQASGVVLPIISHIELTITADTIVPVNRISWGTIKAQYSAGR